MAAGYSGTPLAKKLGVKAGHTVCVLDRPHDFDEFFIDLPDDVTIGSELNNEPDVVIAFNLDEASFRARLDTIAEAIFPDRTLWVAWPKKASGVVTDLSGDVVRAAVLETKLVDVKVCAISDVWSGLKVVWRKEHRRR